MLTLIVSLVAIFLPWFLLLGFLTLVAAAFRIFLPRLKGHLGEGSVNFLAKSFLDQNVYHLIPDVTLPTPDGTTQIDHVIVSRYGIFVVETKNYKGWIYGDEQDAQWTQVLFKRKERFQNPLRQNYKHTKTLADLTGIPASFFISVVVFVGDCTFKTIMPANVVRAFGFPGYIRNHQNVIIKDEQVPEIVSVIREWAGTVTDERKRSHVDQVRQNREPVSVTATAPVCPRCGAVMALRTNRKDGSRFWGCPKYPGCRGVRKAA